jgi:hypothetical protein
VPVVGVYRATAAIRRATRAALVGLANAVTAEGGRTTATVVRASVAIFAVEATAHPVTTDPLVHGWHRDRGGWEGEERSRDEAEAQGEEDLASFQHHRLLAVSQEETAISDTMTNRVSPTVERAIMHGVEILSMLFKEKA